MKNSAQMFKGIMLATLVSGTLDAIAGVTVFDFVLGRLTIVGVLQWIASGVFGKEAFNMGFVGAFYGMIFHYIIALGFSAGLFLVYKKLTVIKDYPVFTGLAYGAYIWIIMNLLVLPNSNTVLGNFESGIAIVGIVWHMTLVGLPICYIANKTFEGR